MEIKDNIKHPQIVNIDGTPITVEELHDYIKIFIPGKWYKNIGLDNHLSIRKNRYVRLLEIKNNNFYIDCFITNGHYSTPGMFTHVEHGKNVGLPSQGTQQHPSSHYYPLALVKDAIMLTDLSEIQSFLPDVHIDKQQKNLRLWKLMINK